MSKWRMESGEEEEDEETRRDEPEGGGELPGSRPSQSRGVADPRDSPNVIAADRPLPRIAAPQLLWPGACRLTVSPY